jgi:hypothetical protein
MSQQKLEKDLAHPVDLLGPGSDDQIVFRLMHARGNELRPATHFRFHDAEAASSEGLQVLVVTERGNRYPRTSSGIEDSHPCRRPHLFPVDLHAEPTHCALRFLTIVL